MNEIDKLLADLERTAPPPVLDRVRELVGALLDVHAAGLDTIMGVLTARGEPGRAIVNELVRDRTVHSLLLLHGVHPISLLGRVQTALAEVAPALRSQGAVAALVLADNGRVVVRIDALPDERPRGTVRQLVEQALGEAASDAAVEVTLGFDDAANFVPVGRLGGSR